MKTRNNGHYEAGFYKSKFKTTESLETKLKSSKRDSPNNWSQEFKKIINSFNIIIIKNLKKSKNPIIRTKIEISMKFKNILKKKFNLGYKFEKMDEFLSFFNIETERYIQSNNLNECLYFVLAGSFEMKLNKKSWIEFKAKNKNIKKLQKNISVSVKFIRENKTNLTDTQNSKLQEYLKNMF